MAVVAAAIAVVAVEEDVETEFAVGNALGEGFVGNFEKHIDLVIIEDFSALQANSLSFSVNDAGHIFGIECIPIGRIAVDGDAFGLY